MPDLVVLSVISVSLHAMTTVGHENSLDILVLYGVGSEYWDTGQVCLEGLFHRRCTSHGDWRVPMLGRLCSCRNNKNAPLGI